jgi:hypothetical protein
MRGAIIDGTVTFGSAAAASAAADPNRKNRLDRFMSLMI